MTKPRSVRLGIILKVARRKEQSAAIRLEQARQQLHTCQKQLSELSAYNNEYRQRIAQQQGAVGVQKLIAYRQFLLQLSSAEEEQVNVVTRQQQQVNFFKQQCQAVYHRRKLIEQLIERTRHVEIREGDRRDQRELDELAIRQLSYKPPG